MPRIIHFESQFAGMADAELRKASLSLRYRAKSREPLDRLLPEAYGLVREAARRKLNMRHFDVQLLGGIAMHHRSIVEMQTGEGKTLTAILPLYLYAIGGQGAHLATANDYLAHRDAEWMRPVYECLGLSVGVIQAQMPTPARRKAYACDVTYGTAKEFGFDFLRDRLLLRRIREGTSDKLAKMLGHEVLDDRSEEPVHRNSHFILADEADSLLIDEASTPLIISALPTEAEKIKQQCYKWASLATTKFKEREDYTYDHHKQTLELTSEGRLQVRNLPKPPALASVGMSDLYQYIERALRVEKSFTRDRHYVVRDGEIVIVDEFTGRLGEGRKWRDGVHQAVEARENVEITVDAGQAARITVQDFFIRYEHLAGMTGTGSDSSRELSKIYRVRVVPIPTHRPSRRKKLPSRVFIDADAKWKEIIQEIREMHATRRPVLVGTRSIDKSEELSRMLEAAKIDHTVLNARQIEREAEIVAQAGQMDRVTVSTNMAGRGTDIKLGEGVAELGGLHVICTEMHDAARIDRQLIGRCGRQGDPGSYRYFLAAADDILRDGFGPEKAKKFLESAQRQGRKLDSWAPLFRKAQKRIERRHFRNRQVLMHYEKERKKMMTQMGQDCYLDVPS